MRLNAQSIGLKIHQARVAKGMTQEELAKALAIDRGSVSRWETGRSIPSQVGIPKVAKILGQTPDFLLQGAGDLSPFGQSKSYVAAAPRKRARAKKSRRKVARPTELKAKTEKKMLQDIINAWDLAKLEVRLVAALLITGEWSYKLKLMNREISVDEALIEALKKEPRSYL